MKLAVLPFLKKGPAVVEIPVNFGFKKSTKTHITVQVLMNVTLSLLPWTKWKSIKLLKSWTTLNAQWSTLVSVELVRAMSSLNCHAKLKHQSLQLVKTLKPFEWNYEGLTGSAYRWLETSQRSGLWSRHSSFPWFKLPICWSLRSLQKHWKIHPSGYRPFTNLVNAMPFDASILWWCRSSSQKQSLTKWIQLSLLHGGVQTLRTTKNWRDYMNKLEGKTEGELQLYQVTMQSTNMLQIKTLSIQST